jgi:hypothetical protein
MSSARPARPPGTSRGGSGTTGKCPNCLPNPCPTSNAAEPYSWTTRRVATAESCCYYGGGGGSGGGPASC